MRTLTIFCMVVLCAPPTCFSQAAISRYQKMERLQTALRIHHLTLAEEFEHIGVSGVQMRNLIENYADERTPTEQKTIPDFSDLARVSYPSGLERWLRSTTIKTEAIQQPRTTFLYDPVSGRNLPTPNPDGMLWKVSSTTDYSQLVPTTSDIFAQATALQAVGIKEIDANTHAFCSSFVTANTSPATQAEHNLSTRRLSQCLLRSSPKYTVAHVVSAFKGTFSYSQNPSVVSGAPVVLGDILGRNAFSGQADFDPGKLFLTGSDWLNAYQSAALYGPRSEASFANFVAVRCGGISSFTDRANSRIRSRKCVDSVSGPHGWARFAAVAIPIVTFIEKTNFDYTAATGSLTPNNYPSRKLADITFSVDLTRWLPSAKSRQDALSMLGKIAAKQAVTITKPEPTRLDKLMQYWAVNPEALEADNSLYMNLVLAVNDLE